MISENSAVTGPSLRRPTSRIFLKFRFAVDGYYQLALKCLNAEIILFNLGLSNFTRPLGQIIYHVATTVDGFIADKNGECPPSMFPYEGDHIPDFLNQIKVYDYVLMGGKTYEYGFKFGLKPGEPGYQGIKHFVFSKTLDFTSTNDVELVKENAVEYIRNLKKGDKKIWLCGGAQLAASLLEHELLDILKLKVNPTMAGDGLRFFGDSRKNVSLDLTDLKKYESGVILTTYTIKYNGPL